MFYFGLGGPSKSLPNFSFLFHLDWISFLDKHATHFGPPPTGQNFPVLGFLPSVMIIPQLSTSSKSRLVLKISKDDSISHFGPPGQISQVLDFSLLFEWSPCKSAKFQLSTSAISVLSFLENKMCNLLLYI
jgi:hypothetical protein